jgi:hypothetical protein
LICGRPERRGHEHHLHFARHQRGDCRTGAFIRDVTILVPARALNNALARCTVLPMPGEPYEIFASGFFRERDEFFRRLRGHAGIHSENVAVRRAQMRNGREVPDRVERQLLIDARISPRTSRT